MSAPVGYIVPFTRERRFRPTGLVEELARRGANVSWQPWDEHHADEPDGLIRHRSDDILVATAELSHAERSKLSSAHAATLSTSDHERVARATAKYLVRSSTFEVTSLVRLVADVLAETCDGVALLVAKL
jgi:hypothetical protein